jgi:hypothetical protein
MLRAERFRFPAFSFGEVPMPKPTRLPPLLLAAFAVALPLASAAAAETLRCRSVNGNTTCSGTGAVSCQTVNGRTTCVGGNGAVVQQFGGTTPAPAPPSVEGEDEAAEPGWRERTGPRARPGGAGGERRLSIERRGPGGSWLSLEREGGRMRLRTDSYAVDLD